MQDEEVWEVVLSEVASRHGWKLEVERGSKESEYKVDNLG